MALFYLFLIALLHVCTGIGGSTNITFGGCDSPNQTCADCYYKLKESLLKRDANIQSLSRNFFPPNANIPEFVTVTYCFDEHCTTNQKWFWTHDSSYLFFPIETFQFLSLFFGKPASLFSQKLTITLDNQCKTADLKLMTLLTQRLKNFVQRASFDPVIDDNYFARAENSSDDDLSIPKAIYLLSFHIISSILAVIIASITLMICLNTKTWYRALKKGAKMTKREKYIKSKIFSVSATANFINLYALVLDSLAIYYIVKGEVSINEHYVHALPYYVTCIDAIGAIIWICSWILACILPFTEHSKYVYVCLMASIVGPCLTIVVHVPYIAIAYLNDASYSTSIFIYYTVSILAVFGTLDLSYGTCQGAIIVKKNGKNIYENKKYYYCWCDILSTKSTTVVLGILVVGFTITVIALVCFITAALVVIPISNAYTDVSQRLIGFYQTMVIFVGAYLIYYNFFKRTPSLESVVKERVKEIKCSDKGWQKLSKDEKVKVFYTKFVDIVASYTTDPERSEPLDESTDDNEDDEDEDEQH